MNQISILKWFLISGITDCIGEVSVNRFQLSTNKTLKQPVSAEQTTQVLISTEETTFKAQAEKLAYSATNLTELHAALLQFDGCSLKKTAQHTLSGTGITETSKILCLIDTPKSADEKNGHLASGETGELLIKMLKAINLDCAVNTHLAPIIPWRLPGDRFPTDSEINICLPFIQKRIELLKPQAILMFGSIPVKSLLNIDSIPKARQQSLFYTLTTGKQIPVVATFGPDMVRKSQSYRKNAWEDLQKLATIIANS